jgi:Cu/Ag efflux pump CusA
MRRIAVPMVGGMLSSTFLTLNVIPYLWFRKTATDPIAQEAAVPGQREQPAE